MLKRNLICLCLLFCIANTKSFAQNNSRIVFYRNDAFYVLPIRSFSLFRNGQKIAKVREHHFCIYDAASVDGNYYMAPTKKHNLTIDSETGTIRFIELKIRSGGFLDKSYIQKVNFSEFSRLYRKKKWFRRYLSEAGYDSLDSLINGYKVIN